MLAGLHHDVGRAGGEFTTPRFKRHRFARRRLHKPKATCGISRNRLVGFADLGDRDFDTGLRAPIDVGHHAAQGGRNKQAVHGWK